jgi:hypothetical protein
MAAASAASTAAIQLLAVAFYSAAGSRLAIFALVLGIFLLGSHPTPFVVSS